MRAFLAHLRGEPRACSVVRVPTPEDEDRKRRTREREQLVKERTSAYQPDQGAAARPGHPRRHAVEAGLPVRRLTRYAPVTGVRCPPRLKEEIRREHERLVLVYKQIKALEAENSPRTVRRRPGRWRRRSFSWPNSRALGR